VNALGTVQLLDEFACLRLTASPNVLQIYEIFQDSRHYFLVNEPYYGGDMQSLRRRAKRDGVNMDEAWWKNIFRQALEALDHLHGHAMIHCDVKEPNFMLKTKDYHRPCVVLIDFGIARSFADPSSEIRGTPGYIPPESFDTGKWYPQGDMFCLGVCMVQMMADKLAPVGNRTPFSKGGIFLEGAPQIPDIQRATKTRQPPFHLMRPQVPGLIKLVQAMLEKKLLKRPRAGQVLLDPYMAQTGGGLGARGSSRASSLPSRTPSAPASEAQRRSSVEGIGKRVEVWSNSKGSWVAATITDVSAVDQTIEETVASDRTTRHKLQLSAGAVKVSLDGSKDAIKWIQPAEFAAHLREPKSSMPASGINVQVERLLPDQLPRRCSDAEISLRNQNEVRQPLERRLFDAEQLGVHRELVLPPKPNTSWTGGTRVEVWSNSKNAWMAGTITEVVLADRTVKEVLGNGAVQELEIPAGALRVSIDGSQARKWLMPSEVESQLRQRRESQSATVPSSAPSRVPATPEFEKPRLLPESGEALEETDVDPTAACVPVATSIFEQSPNGLVMQPLSRTRVTSELPEVVEE